MVAGGATVVNRAGALGVDLASPLDIPMPYTAAELAFQGKQLPPEERERLVDELLASLNEPAAKELDAAWSDEIERRLNAYERGEVIALSAEEVFAKARTIAK